MNCRAGSLICLTIGAIVSFGGCQAHNEPAGRAAVANARSAAQPIRGLVVDDDARPVANARVRIKGTAVMTLSDHEGRFELTPASDERPLRVVASRTGYYIGGNDWNAGDETRIVLHPHPTEDHADYAWIDPRPDEASSDRCGNCHPEIYREWSSSAHARSALNPRFMNVYEGTDAAGNEDVGWNLLRDYPEGAGVCAACHFPSLDPTIDDFADLRRVSGVDQLGVHCDFCHKVADVSVENVGLNHGRFAMQLIRPGPGEKLLFGPLDDVDRGEDVYSPLYRDSRYCASCHEGILFGTHAYSTYSEWLASSYAERGVQCQDCHMATTGTMTNLAPGHGGIERDPQTLSSHVMPGGDREFLRDHLTLDATAKREGDRVSVTIEVQARGIGHRVPTGHPSRQILLWVRATDADGRDIALLDGPRLPSQAGDGPIEDGGLAGQPGKRYARTIESLDGDPDVPYWEVTNDVSDTRLMPDELDHQTFVFDAEFATQIEAQLIYRRFSKSVADEKGWTNNEFVIQRASVELP